jgi:hypothetical protein
MGRNWQLSLFFLLIVSSFHESINLIIFAVYSNTELMIGKASKAE